MIKKKTSEGLGLSLNYKGVWREKVAFGRNLEVKGGHRESLEPHMDMEIRAGQNFTSSLRGPV